MLVATRKYLVGSPRALLYGGIVAAALMVGALVVYGNKGMEIAGWGVPVVAVAVAALPVALARWTFVFWTLLLWLFVEDLARKIAGNDIGIYFIKDGIYLLLLFGILNDVRLKGAWREATGIARFPFYVLMAWALIMSLPSGMADWRIPLVGLRLTFFYAPLVVVGYLIAQKPELFRRFLTGIAMLGGLASLLGVVQAVVGPGFLSPNEDIASLPHLFLYRKAGSTEILQPTGTFVDPSRFAAMSVLALALGLAAVSSTRGWARKLTLSSTVASAAAVWISGGRAALVLSALLAAGGVLAWRARKRKSPFSGVAPIAIVIGAVAFMSFAVPDLFQSRLDWYSHTLGGFGPETVVTRRWMDYSNDTVRGIHIGGIVGHGTGSEALGRRYLYGDGSSRSINAVEGGYASVAVEWGIVGLILWLSWSFIWARRLWICVRGAVSERSAALIATMWIIAILFVWFFAGLSIFQNYFTNAYFWLLSGLVFGVPQLASRRHPESNLRGD